jgi:RNA polymerase sigma-70 factor (ECF subfamily)
VSRAAEHIADLVDRANAGDERAREHLLHWLSPILRGFFIKRIQLRPEVDDLVQNTLIRVHQGLSSLRESSSLKAFALKAALFELQDYYRGRYGPKERPLESSEFRDPEATLRASVSIDLERALRELTPQARRIIELREYGYKYAEIAELIDSTEAAVKMQVKRAFEKLRSILGAIVLWFTMLLIG